MLNINCAHTYLQNFFFSESLLTENVISSSSWQSVRILWSDKHTHTFSLSVFHSPSLSLSLRFSPSVSQKHSKDLEIIVLLDKNNLTRSQCFLLWGEGTFHVSFITPIQSSTEYSQIFCPGLLEQKASLPWLEICRALQTNVTLYFLNSSHVFLSYIVIKYLRKKAFASKVVHHTVISP